MFSIFNTELHKLHKVLVILTDITLEYNFYYCHNYNAPSLTLLINIVDVTLFRLYTVDDTSVVYFIKNYIIVSRR